MTTTTLRDGYMVAYRSADGAIYLDEVTMVLLGYSTTPQGAVNAWLPTGLQIIAGDPATKLSALTTFYGDPTQETPNGQPADDGAGFYLVVHVAVTRTIADDGTWTLATAISRDFAN
ncbi:hypothetical protein OG548_08195 [Streptomyces sp. NBC_01356]|uniref:hypothetical protein n=1 Tax=Streptomyces sp. NBC_01356 TaxID=2903836 RepID=UPI002E2FAAA8|nr:hypothetical protein [Streptomyces sp. NBC_01356]